MQPLIVGKLLEHGAVGRGDVGGVAGQSDPAERSLALTEQRSDVGGQKAGIVERPVESTEGGFRAQAVPVVEDLGTLVGVGDHRRTVRRHRQPGPADELLRVVTGELCSGFDGEVGGYVRQRVVSARLVGHDVGGKVAVDERRQDDRRIADDTYRERPACVAGSDTPSHGVIDGVGDLVEIAVLDPPSDAVLVHVDAQRHPTVHRDRQRLGAAHPAEAGGDRDRPGERAAETTPRDLGEALVGALEDALRSDVDP